MAKNITVLGQKTTYFDEYNPGVLNPISRALGRAKLKYLNFQGYDLWRCYELTFLNRLGIPLQALGEIIVPASSPYIIESKSLKLYLNSFSMTRFDDLKQVSDVIKHDLDQALDCECQVNLFEINDEEAARRFSFSTLPGKLIDLKEGLCIEDYEVNPELLQSATGPRVEETLRSNMLRTLCPVTGQPDYASVSIHYQGVQINHQDLLRYLISFRKHRGFHEQCAEQIYSDLMTRLKIDRLTVTACFTRRGGIDINPVRSSFDYFEAPIRTVRQ